jgi:alpha-ketoglutaric semialdehyde dehydrogenase
MTINGEMLLGNRAVKGSDSAIFARNPATGEKMEPAFLGGTKDDVQLACELAESAFDEYRNIPLQQRATFLETIADEILELGDALIQRAVAESGLPQVRIEGERGRTLGQLKLQSSQQVAQFMMESSQPETLAVTQYRSWFVRREKTIR